MAIALDTSTQANGTTTALTWSHTCTGSNLKLFVHVHTAGASLPSSVTFNGINLTQIQSNGNLSSLWYLDNPTTGAHNIIINASNQFLGGSGASYTGCASGIDNSANTTASSTNTFSEALTPVFPSCWVIFGNICGNNETISSNNGNTTVRQEVSGGVSGHSSLSDTNALVNPPASTTMSTKVTSSATWRGCVASFAPFDSSARYWVGGSGTWDTTSTTHWATSSGGSAGAAPPTSVTTVTHFDGNSGAGTVTTGASLIMIDLDFTGYTGTLAGSNTMNVSGSLTLVSGMTLTYTGALTFSALATGKTIATGGKILLSAVTFNGIGGGWTLQDDCTAVSVTLTNGTLSLSSRTLSLTGTGTTWNANGGSISAGTSTIKYTDASSSTKAFAGNSLTYNNLWITGSGTGTYLIVGNNTFNDFKVDTPPHTVQFTSRSIQTISSFTVNGTAGNLMTLQSTISGTPWYLVKVGSSPVVCDYLSLQDSVATPQ